MNGLHYIPRSSSALPLQSFHAHSRNPSSAITSLAVMKATTDLPRLVSVKAVSSSTSSTEMENADADADADAEEEKSEIYSHNMTEAMGAVLTYKHELGMNYNFIRPDLIVGSCLQTPDDVDKLRSIGVKTIFCLQQDSDLEYPRQLYLLHTLIYVQKRFNRYFLQLLIWERKRLLYLTVELAHMFWFEGYKLSDGHSLLLSKRSCSPKLDAIKSATADILTGLRKKLVTLTWKGSNCSTVEVSGLDIGWGQRMPLKYDNEQCLWILQREMLEGRYEYKYIIDGEWTCNSNELVTPANKDGHVNNYVEVFDSDPNSITAALWKRLMSDDPYLTENEQLKIRQFLEACIED